MRLLKDASENYPVWLAAIRSAQRKVYFENYIVDDDAILRVVVAEEDSPE